MEAALRRPDERTDGGGGVTQDTTLPVVTVNDVMWAGEEGEWIAAEGHVDIDSFTAAADALTRRDIAEDMPEDELPSAGFTAQHIWQRPMTWQWFLDHYPADFATTENYDRMCEEGPYEPCGPDDEGAEAWTVIGTGA